MTLLEEIAAAATDASHSLSDLLRKCQILAFRLHHEPFKHWVNHELHGYPDEPPPPPYRTGHRGLVKAELIGAFGVAGNVEVPISQFPRDLRDEMTRFDFYQGVGTLEALIADARRSNKPSIISPFPVEIAAQMQVWQGYQTVAMWNEVPIAVVAGVLDQVRSRALEFVLEIEAENPEAGTIATEDPPVPLARADVIYNNVILGGQVALGEGANVNVNQGDLSSLMRYLEALGIDTSDREALQEAIAADKNTLGSRVKAWLGDIVIKATASGGRISEGLVAAALAHFLGVA